MEPFEFSLPTKVVFAAGALDELGERTQALGQYAFLVIGQGSVKRLGFYDRSVRSLQKAGVRVSTFEGIEPNPRVATVDRAAGECRRFGCDVVVALGGGSVMDSAKLIAAVVKNGGSAWDYVNWSDRKPRAIREALPVVTVPTLAATGSEVNGGAVVTNEKTNEKSYVVDGLLIPKVAIWDPDLTVSVSKDYTADGGIDILCHLLETYLTGDVKQSQVQDRLVEAMARVVLDNLPKVLRNLKDLEARTELAWCSSLALCGLTQAGRSGPFTIHWLEHTLSGHYNISHGRGLGILLVPYMEETWKDRPERYALLGRRVFRLRGLTDRAVAQRTPQAMRRWLQSAGCFWRLRDVGTGPEKFEQMAEDAIRVNGGGKPYLAGPRKLYKKDIVTIYCAAL